MQAYAAWQVDLVLNFRQINLSTFVEFKSFKAGGCLLDAFWNSTFFPGETPRST